MALQNPGTIVFLGGLHFQGDAVDFQIARKIVKDAFKTKGIDGIEEEDIKVKDKRVNENTHNFYAFVTFKSQEAAEKAIALGTIQVKGKDVKIQKYSLEKDYQLYIKDIGTIDEKQLNDFLSKTGKIDNISIYSDRTRTALVKFEKSEHAEELLKKPEQTINGITIKIEKYIPKQERRDEDHHRQLYLKKIPMIKQKGKLEQLLLQQFEKYGEVTRKIDIECKQNIKSGSAVISYENSKSCQLARQKFNVKLFDSNSPMELDFYLTKRDRQLMGTLFIGNIKGDVDISEFVKLFSKFGKVEAHSFNKTPSRNDNGLIQKGTLTYDTKDSMKDALAQWTSIPNIYNYFNQKPLVTIYQDKSERTEFLRTTKPVRQQFIQPQMRPQFPMAPYGFPQMNPMMPNQFFSGPPGGIPNPMGNPMVNPMGNPYGNPLSGNPAGRPGNQSK